MRVHFTEREQGPERLVCEAEIHFEEGPIAGTRLVGFSLWRGPEGEVYVTFPSRAFGAGADGVLGGAGLRKEPHDDVEYRAASE